MEGLRHFIEEQRQSSRSEQGCMQPCSVQLAFTAWWKIGRTVMSSSRSRKKSDCCGPEKRGNETPNTVVCRGQQLPMSEMWNRHLVHENERKMHGPRTCHIFDENGENDFWEVMIW